METNKNAQIFQKICDLVTGADFMQGQLTFFQKNCQAFTDDDENKLEYTTIHQDYIKLIDELIESSMLQEFTQEEVDQFYEAFPNNYKEYEKTNQDAVDTLYAAIDFAKFKEQMLKFKGGIKDQNVEDQKKMDDDFKVDGLNFDQLAAEPLNDPAYKWQKVVTLDKPQYKGEVFARPKGDRSAGVSIIRMNLVFKNCKRQWHLDLMKDGPPIKNMVERRVVEEFNEHNKIIYVKLNFGLMSQRDQFIYKEVVENDNGTTQLNIRSVQGDKYPVTPGIVRIEMYKSQQIKEVGDDLHVTDISTFDFKGYFPMRLMSMMMGTMMPKAIEEVNEQYNVFRKAG